MNKLNEVAKLLGIEIGERFHIKSDDHIYNTDEYYLDDSGEVMIVDKSGQEEKTVWLPALITGSAEIIPIRKQLNTGDRYYVVAYNDEFAEFDRSKGIPNESIKHRQWKSIPIDILMYTLGVVRKNHEDCKNHFWEDYDKLRSFVTSPPNLEPLKIEEVTSVATVKDCKRDSYDSDIVGVCSCCSNTVVYGKDTKCPKCDSRLEWDEEMIDSEFDKNEFIDSSTTEPVYVEETYYFEENLETCKDFLRQFDFDEIVDEEQLAKLDGKLVFLKFVNEPKGFFTVNHKYKRLYRGSSFYSYDYFFKWDSKGTNKLYKITHNK